MNLGIRHGAGFKPAIKNIADTAHHGFAGRIIGIGINHIVNIRFVQIGYIKPGFFFDFGQRTEDINARELRVVRLPDRNRRSPETVAGNRPVTGAFQPFAEAAVFDMFGNPVNLLIVFNHIIAEIRHFDKPAGHGLIDQRGVGAPTERIGVGVLFLFDKKAVFFEPLHNRFIGFEDLFSFIIGNFRGKFAGFVNRADNRKMFIISPAGFKVILTKARRNMDNAGSVFGGNKLTAQHPECSFFF